MNESNFHGANSNLPLSLDESDLARWIAELHQADQTVQDMMAVELWAIIQTIDEVMPGFWGRYMANRHDIMRQFLADRRQRKSGDRGSAAKSSPSIPPSPLASYFSHRFPASRPPTSDAAPSTPPIAADPPVAEAPSDDPPPAPASSSSVPAPLSFTHVITETPEQKRRLDRVQKHVVTLSHVQHQPWLQVLSTDTSDSDTGLLGLTRLGIACWSTRHFWMPSAQSEDTFALQTVTDYVLKPNELVICALGFHVKGIASPVKVELPRSHQTEYQISATWMADLPRIPFSLRQQVRHECAIQLHNRGSQPYVIKAGDPLCRLEFYWSESLA